MKTFGGWPAIMHSDYEQVQRISSALTKEMKERIVQIYPDKQAMVIEGSGEDGVYVTCLSACECVDFNRRQKPCKHMYLLAHELGLFDGHPKYRAGDFDAEAEMDRYRALYTEGKLKADAYVAICKGLALVKKKK